MWEKHLDNIVDIAINVVGGHHAISTGNFKSTVESLFDGEKRLITRALRKHKNEESNRSRIRRKKKIKDWSTHLALFEHIPTIDRTEIDENEEYVVNEMQEEDDMESE